MPYRDAKEVLLARAAEIEQELESLREKAQALAAVQLRENELRSELADVRHLLEGSSQEAPPVREIDDVSVASPCTADWNKMVGNGRKRFCGACDQYVYNVEALTRAEVAALIDEGGRLCLRLFRRTDGTLMTADCPVGRRRVRLKQVATVIGGGLLAGAAVAAVIRSGRPSELHDLYTVDVSTHGHHHQLASPNPGEARMAGTNPVPLPALAPVPVDPPPPEPDQRTHMMGHISRTPEGRQRHSYPTKIDRDIF
jgi:hypothetical protein